VNFGEYENSKYLLLGLSPDKIARLWDVTSRPMRLVAVVRDPLSQITNAFLTEDRRIVLLGPTHFSVNDWQFDNLVRDLCSRLGNNPTDLSSVESTLYRDVCPPKFAGD
jgi:hypothetical protein